MEEIEGEDANVEIDFESPAPLQTPLHSSSMHSMTSASTDTSERIGDASSVRNSEPRRFKSLAEIYNDTEIFDIIDELMLLKVEGPMSFGEAIKEKEWQDAMQLEFDTIEKNDTWTLMDLPPGHKAVRLKWVYKVKKDPEGNMVKYKARLVAKGYV